ncbi:hypothetical protein ABZT02_43280 [Streptomyces sp. NPDC005402]
MRHPVGYAARSWRVGIISKVVLVLAAVALYIVIRLRSRSSAQHRRTS